MDLGASLAARLASPQDMSTWPPAWRNHGVDVPSNRPRPDFDAYSTAVSMLPFVFGTDWSDWSVVRTYPYVLRLIGPS
eukprot:8056609-Pyramimonas_sp.AAC.1